MRLFGIFRIRKEERWGAFVAFIVAVLLNAINIVHYADRFSIVGKDTWGQFVKAWHVSGFDPITYAVITEWRVGYNIYRHPLLPYFMWPLTKINEALTALTGYNCVIYVTAAILIFCAVYSFIFLNRIFTDIIGVSRNEGYALSALAFSFAYIMLAAIVPDHFIMSMFCLTAAIYVFGREWAIVPEKRVKSSVADACVLFVITAGVTLSNGIKVIAAAFLAKGKKFFPHYFISLLILSGIVWGSARLSYHYLVLPTEQARHQKAQEKREAQINRLTAKYGEEKRDSIEKMLKEKKARRYRLSAVYKHTGKPIAQGEFMRWTDKTTDRWDVAVECLFGEGIMIHEKYLLGDVLVNRPVIVRYVNWFNYVVEALLILFSLIGIWMGRKSRFLWLCLSCFAIDMMLHLGLGFGINEMAIMSAHYLWILPIAMAYFVRYAPQRLRLANISLIIALTLYLTIWNVTLLIEYMYF